MSAEKRILFLGVGGAGMAPLAMWCAEKGDLIFGYDDYFKQSALDYLINSKVELLDAVLIEDLKSYKEIVPKAVDEYFANSEYKPLFNVVDYTGRSAIKINNMIGE